MKDKFEKLDARISSTLDMLQKNMSDKVTASRLMQRLRRLQNKEQKMLSRMLSRQHLRIARSTNKQKIDLEIYHLCAVEALIDAAVVEILNLKGNCNER